MAVGIGCGSISERCATNLRCLQTGVDNHGDTETRRFHGVFSSSASPVWARAAEGRSVARPSYTKLSQIGAALTCGFPTKIRGPALNTEVTEARRDGHDHPAERSQVSPTTWAKRKPQNADSSLCSPCLRVFVVSLRPRRNRSLIVQCARQSLDEEDG